MGLIEKIFTGQLALDRKRNKLIKGELTKLYAGGRITRNRNSPSGVFRSPEDMRDTTERLRMIRDAREMEDDNPIAGLALDAYEVYGLGTVRYQPMTGDKDFNREISNWLKHWFENCDITDRFSFQDIARLALRGKKRDGEAGIIHRVSGGDYKLQLISGDRIGNPTIVKMATEFDRNGIIIDEDGRPQSYRIFRQTPNTYAYTFDAEISAPYFSHIFDAFRPDQYHGVSAFKSVLTRLRDLEEVMEYTRLNIKYRSTQLPYFKTEDGASPINAGYDDGAPINGKKDSAGVDLQTVAGAEQLYLRTTEGVFEFPNDFPNQQFEPIAEMQIREILSGLGLAYEFIWNPEKLTGTVGRLIVERQDRVMRKERQNMERQFMRRTVMRAIQHGIDTGQIRGDHANKFEGEFFYGARISADYGRDHKTDMELVAAGLLTRAEYQHIHGHDPEVIRSVKLEETLGLVEDSKKVAAASGLSLENAMNVVAKHYSNPPQSQSKTESVTESFTHDDKGERETLSSGHKPTAEMAANAERALDRRAELPKSKRGMTDTGVARARDLKNRRNLSEATVREMAAWFARHESTSRNSPNYDKREKAWVAWQGWGGDAGKTWSQSITKRLDKKE